MVDDVGGIAYGWVDRGDMTMKPGQITVTSFGTLQGVFRPTIRVYFEHPRHGILFDETTKTIRCRSRKRAIVLGREWRKSPEGKDAIALVFARIASNPDNTIPDFGG